MFTEQLTLQHLIISLTFIIGGFFVGVVIEKIIFARLKKITVRTKWRGDEIIISALHGITILWFCIAGIYGAILNLPFNATLANVLQKILLIIILFSATVVFARLAAGFVQFHSKKTDRALPSASLINNLIRGVIFILGILIILQSLGISITPLITALGVGGLAVALALQPTLSNLFAGLQIIISRQVEVGDYVELDSGEKGYVTDISWRNTTIKAIHNNLIVVPNSKLANTIVTNYNQPQMEMAVLVQVGVSYDSDLERVEKITNEVAKKVMKEVQGAQSDFEPFIRYRAFDDFSINFTVILRVKEFFSKYLVRHEFIKALHKRYIEEGIEIPFPIRTVHLKEQK